MFSLPTFEIESEALHKLNVYVTLSFQADNVCI